MSVVSVINYKGGVGKTTITANIGAELALRGRKVLLIDLDPQASLTFSFYRVTEWQDELAERKTVLRWFESFVANRTVDPLRDYLLTPPVVNELVRPNGGRLDLLASHLGLIEIDLDLAAALGGARFQATNPGFLAVHGMLGAALEEPPFRGYDAILIDCAPNFNMVTRTAIIASDQVLIPARPDYLSTLGIDYLRTRMSSLVDGYNDAAGQVVVNPEILGVVYTMVQYAGSDPIKAQRSTMDQTRQIEIPIFHQTVRDNKSAFTESGTSGIPAVLAESGNQAVQTLQYELQQLTSEFLARTRM